MSEEKDVDHASVQEGVSEREALWLWMMRRNASEPVLRFDRSLKVGKLTVRLSWRSRKNFWGRFGGGFNWKAGFSAGGRTVYFHLLIADLRFDYS